ncbi:hypothetical protein HJFPF1_01001 [Paramyrothecium foliicola]|nr:hypothetical protein HJFPF1_01001 [Paramyrothecium foliicola]
MTSSKSFRASMFPSSFSLSSLRSALDSEESPRKNHPRNKSVDIANIQISDTDSSQSVGRNAPSPEMPDYTHEKPPARPELRKSKTWSNRLSTFLPSLISPVTDPSQAVLRKPLAPSRDTPPSTATTPPPPYNYDEPTTRQNEILLDQTVNGADVHPPRRSSLFVAYGVSSAPPTAPPVHTNEPELLQSPQAMDPMPPSPEEAPRGVLKKQQQIPVNQRINIVQDNEPTEGQTRKPSKLQKDHFARPRSNSLQKHQQPPPPQVPTTRHTLATSEPRGRSVSEQLPTAAQNRMSGPLGSATTNTLRPEGSQSPSRGRARRSWLPGGRSRSNSADLRNGKGKRGSAPAAWVMADDGSQAEYNTWFLNKGEKVPELWNENGDVLVYLYPKGSGCGPSFKIPHFTISSSYIFNELIHSDQDSTSSSRRRTRSFTGRNSLTAEDASRIYAPSASPPPPEDSGELRLYLPTAPPSESGQLSTPGENSLSELERLVGIRNLFAFLTGQPLVATKNHQTIFQAFLQISSLLQEFGFMSEDGTTFGYAVDLSFGFYMEQLALADCRHSREKTVEALILGERMRSIDLYSEAFAHAAGKYTAIMDLQLPIYDLITPHTRQGLERAHLDLISRQHDVNQNLEQFDFPSLFAGIANSTSISELRMVRFKIWKNSFSKMRQFVLSHYKAAFGSWPPKASSKKNPFAESGLNRLVLKMLYSDMCALYDLLVDRKNLTSRVMDEVPAISGEAGKMTISALRNILSEFDRSKPPVLPPIPYDLPQLPSMTSVLETYNTLSTREQSKFDKKIKEHELLLVLNKAYNFDTTKISLPFLEEFKEFELRESRGRTAQDLADQRIGYWLFLYVVIQSLPRLVVDAPGLSFTEGTEYFLCEPPMGNPPWIEDKQVRKMWYEVAGGGGLVELSEDAILFSVEATYSRSHCWLAAKKWQGIEGVEPSLTDEPLMSPLHPPPSLFPGQEPPAGSPITATNTLSPSPPPGSPQVTLRPRSTLSPAQNRASHAWRSSIAIGLEPVPMEPPASFSARSGSRSSSVGPRPQSAYLGGRSASAGNLAAMNVGAPKADPAGQGPTSGTTFDDILGGGDKEAQKKTAKKKNRFF